MPNTVFPLSDLNTTEVCRAKEARYKISNNGLEMEAVDVQSGQRETDRKEALRHLEMLGMFYI